MCFYFENPDLVQDPTSCLSLEPLKYLGWLISITSRQRLSAPPGSFSPAFTRGCDETGDLPTQAQRQLDAEHAGAARNGGFGSSVSITNDLDAVGNSYVVLGLD